MSLYVSLIGTISIHNLPPILCNTIWLQCTYWKLANQMGCKKATVGSTNHHHSIFVNHVHVQHFLNCILQDNYIMNSFSLKNIPLNIPYYMIRLNAVMETDIKYVHVFKMKN